MAGMILSQFTASGNRSLAPGKVNRVSTTAVSEHRQLTRRISKTEEE